MGGGGWDFESTKPDQNLVTDDTFMDFKLHIEFRYPRGAIAAFTFVAVMKFRLQTAKE